MNSQILYSELKQELQQLADPLFEVSVDFIQKRGTFLPHGAVLSTNDEVKLIMSVPENYNNQSLSSVEILPLLHKALCEASRNNVKAIGVCEDVNVTFEGEKQTKAIKVLIEHKRGLSIAFYLPIVQTLTKEWQVGNMVVKETKAEVNCWNNNITA